jgi:ribonucleoside-diphosphate reductase beta chain
MKLTPNFSDIIRAIDDPATKSILAFDNIAAVEPKSIILGPELGVLDTGAVIHKRVVEEFQTFKRNDWTWWEFEFQRCQAQWHTVEKHKYEKMVKTIAWQWEGDTAASIAMLNIIGNFITESATIEYETRIADNEIVHARTYAEMTNSAFTDPMAIKREILMAEEVRARLRPIGKALDLIIRVGCEYKLGLRQNDLDTYTYGLFYEVIMLILEKIQFNASFLMTHLLTSDGLFAPISSAVQKIAVDELNFHVPHRLYVITNELETERGQLAWVTMKPVIQWMFNLVLQSELDWLRDHIFADGKELPGGNLTIAQLYTKHCAYSVADFLGLDSDHELVARNPVSSMADWLHIDGSQRSPMDEKGNNYLLMNVVDRKEGTCEGLSNLLFDDDN